MPALTAGLGREGVIPRKAAFVRIHALPALASGFGRQPRVLRKTPLLVRDTLAPLARDSPLFLGIHRGESQFEVGDFFKDSIEALIVPLF